MTVLVNECQGGREQKPNMTKRGDREQIPKKKYKKINLEKFEGLTLRKGGGYFQNTEMFAERPAKIRPR